MAISLSSFLLSISLYSLLVRAATVTYDFDIGWVYASPDGLATRPVIGINGQWPIPQITATKGDRVVVNVKNSLGNETTSLHFHGLYQNGTTHMDGPEGVTQCTISPGSSFTYNFTVRLMLSWNSCYRTTIIDISCRLINRERTGIIRILVASIQMDCAVH